LPVRIDRIEDRGRLRLARVMLDGAPLVATVAPGFAPDGDTAHVAFDPAQLHLYADDRLVAA
jgi:glycerol transport system ATP-binding protein